MNWHRLFTDVGIVSLLLIWCFVAGIFIVFYVPKGISTWVSVVSAGCFAYVIYLLLMKVAK